MKRKLLLLTLCLTVLVGNSSMAVSAAQAKSKSKTPVTQQSKKVVNRYELADITNPKAFEATFNKVKALAAKDNKNDNKAAIANYVRYPLTVYYPKNKKLIIKNKAAFIKNYTKIFTPKVKKALLNQKVQDTFVNHSGVCVGDGELWFGTVGKNNYGIISANIF